ncbi:hypothetical protein SAMN02910456_01889 [Ruminococcaceae bacterium YRB3002]|nr:hypothetical protein SAMN02910456_01889 [Ruminococcaceae bacterium YRB3002]
MSDIDLKTMTREEALKYMGLPEDANDFAIDERFWQLTKRYRGKSEPGSESKLNELTAVYNIACGKRDEQNRKEEARQNASKFLGKTKDEWKNYLSYTWFKMVVILVVAIAFGSIIYNVVFKDRYDCSAVAFGHFNVECELLEERLVTEELKNPYVSAVNMVVHNEQGEVDNAYANQSLAAVLSMYPNMLITDGMTYKYYFSAYSDMSNVYADLQMRLNESVLDHIEPIYISEREAYLATKDYIDYEGIGEQETDAEELDPTPVLIGFRITDENAIKSLGITNLWPESRPEIIISIYAGTSDFNKGEEMIIKLCQSMAFSD